MARKKKLKGGQAKLDANKDGKISGQDFVLLREKKQAGGKAKKDVMDLKYAYQEGGEAGKRNGSMKDQMEGLAISVSPVVVEKEMMPEDNKEMKSDEKKNKFTLKSVTCIVVVVVNSCQSYTIFGHDATFSLCV